MPTVFSSSKSFSSAVFLHINSSQVFFTYSSMSMDLLLLSSWHNSYVPISLHCHSQGSHQVPVSCLKFFSRLTSPPSFPNSTIGIIILKSYFWFLTSLAQPSLTSAACFLLFESFPSVKLMYLSHPFHSPSFLFPSNTTCLSSPNSLSINTQPFIWNFSKTDLDFIHHIQYIPYIKNFVDSVQFRGK